MNEDVVTQIRALREQQEKKRSARNAKILKSLENKSFIDFRPIRLTNLPTKPQSGYTAHQWDKIEEEIATIFINNKILSIEHCRLDNYLGILTANHDELFDSQFHGYEHLKYGVQSKLKSERERVAKEIKLNNMATEIVNQRNRESSEPQLNQQTEQSNSSPQPSNVNSTQTSQPSDANLSNQLNPDSNIENQQLNQTPMNTESIQLVNLSQTPSTLQPQNQSNLLVTQQSSLLQQINQPQSSLSSGVTELNQSNANSSLLEVENQNEDDTGGVMEAINRINQTNTATEQFNNLISNLENESPNVNVNAPPAKRRRGRPLKNI